jgi:hypothetical protein
MRWHWMLAALALLCAATHARAFPLFTTKFVLPENSESQPEVAQKVHAYIEDLAQRTTEETLLRHVLNILEVTVPSREVLLGALVENTIEESMFTLESRYGYVKDEITNTAAASKLSFEVRLNRMKIQDQKILMTVAEVAFSKVNATYTARCALRPQDATQGQRVLLSSRRRGRTWQVLSKTSFNT